MVEILTYREFIERKIHEFDDIRSFNAFEISHELEKTFGVSNKHAKSITNNILKRMCDKNLIKRAEKGIYYKPKLTVFGEIKPTDEQIASSYLTIQFDNIIGYNSGEFFCHEIGLNSLMPKVKEIKSNKYRKQFNTPNIKIKAPVTIINEKNFLYLQILDAISILDVSYIDAQNPELLIRNYILKNKLDYLKLLTFSNAFYSKKTTLTLVRILVEDKNEFTQ